MVNFLTRLVERTLGNVTPVKPLIASRFAPGLTMLSDDRLNLQSEPESNDELEGILSISPWETLSPFTPLNSPDSPNLTSQPDQTQVAIAPTNTTTSSSSHYLSGQNLHLALNDKSLNEYDITKESPALTHPITPEQTISQELINQQIKLESRKLLTKHVVDNTEISAVNSHQEGMAQSFAETSSNVPNQISTPSPQLPLVRSPLSPQPVIQLSPEQTTKQIQPQIKATNPEQPPTSPPNPHQSISQNTISTISESKQTLPISDRQSSSTPTTIQSASIAPNSSVVNQPPLSSPTDNGTSSEPPAAQSTPVRLPLVSSSKLSSQSISPIERSRESSTSTPVDTSQSITPIERSRKSNTSTQAETTTTPTSIQPTLNHPSVQGETSITQASNKPTALRGLGIRDWGLGNDQETATFSIRPALSQGNQSLENSTTTHEKFFPLNPTLLHPHTLFHISANLTTSRHDQAGQSKIESAHRRGVTISEIKSPPTVQVTIGRIDIKGVKPVSPSPSKPKQSRPSLSLNDYLQQRNGGSP